MTGKEFLLKLADQLSHDLTANESIKQFTDNPQLIGAFAEATVRQLVVRMVAPLRVSRGSIVYEAICPGAVPEIDTIIWSPCPMPAVFEAGDFALVPRGSALAFLEIKRSNYSRVGARIETILARQDELLPTFCIPSRQDDRSQQSRSLGVVCLREPGRIDRKLDSLVAAGRVVVLLERTALGQLRTNPKSMFEFVNFLSRVRWYAKTLDGYLGVNWPCEAEGT